MRLAFAGTPAFAAQALSALCDAGFDVALVLTQPDRPAGRGLRLQPSEVKRVALERGLRVLQPVGLKLDGPHAEQAQACRDALQAARVELLVVAAYGLILPGWVLRDMSAPWPDGRARHGCINIHASLLPRWRGAAPIQRAIEAGDECTGVCIMQMDTGLDTGGVIRSASIPIHHAPGTADTAATLQDRLALLGSELLIEVLRLAEHGPLHAEAQSAQGVSYARKVDRQDARIDWSAPAKAIDRKLRAFNPAPGAWTPVGTGVLKVWSAEPAAHPAPAPARVGEVVAVGPIGIQVATGDGVLVLREVQGTGGRRMAAWEYANGHGLRVGARLGDPGAA